MSGDQEKVRTKLVDKIFPRMPDFYGLIDDQCDLLVKTMEEFVKFMETGDPEKGQRIAHVLEKEGDDLKRRNLHVLDTAFATPMDREEIYRAIDGIDHIINYAKTTVREIEAFEMIPDNYMLEMAIQLREGAEALQAGFRVIASTPVDAEPAAMAARKAERRVEKVYRRALAELFEAEEYHTRLLEGGQDMASAVLRCVTEILKRREIYRHMSNASDRLAHVGQTLHDIVVKIA